MMTTLRGLSEKEVYALSRFAANQKWLSMMAAECRFLAKEISEGDMTNLEGEMEERGSVNIDISDPGDEDLRIFSANLDRKYFPVLAHFFAELANAFTRERLDETFALAAGKAFDGEAGNDNGGKA